MIKITKKTLLHLRNGADVIAALQIVPGINDSARRDMISSVNRISKAFHVTPSALPVSESELRLKFQKIHHVQLGISAKSLSNLKSDFKRAIVWARKVSETHTSPAHGKVARMPLSDAWQKVQRDIHPSWRRWTLSRFMRYCSREGVEPQAVCDAVLQAFADELYRLEVCKDPSATIINTIGAWNGFVDTYRTTLPRLSPPPRQGVSIPSIESYPASLSSELNAYSERLLTPWAPDGDFDSMEERPAKPLKPVSVGNIVSSVRKSCFALCKSGFAPDEITSLSVLVQRENYSKILKYYWMRYEGAKPSWLKGLAAHLLAIAKYHVKMDAKALNELKALAKRVEPEETGMTEKNRRLLAQFDDPENLRRLFTLPQKLSKKAEAASIRSSRSARLMMLAVAIDLLQCSTIRMKSLAGLHYQEHFIWGGTPKSPTLNLFIPACEIKNHSAVDTELAADSIRLLKRYMNDWQPLLSASQSAWLFPNRKGHRPSDHLGENITEIIFRETGITMHPHLIRHLAGKLILDEHPDEIVQVSQVLGHKKIETTTQFYAPFRKKEALRRYQQEVLAKWRSKR